jgi:hypothetical protein
MRLEGKEPCRSCCTSHRSSSDMDQVLALGLWTLQLPNQHKVWFEHGHPSSVQYCSDDGFSTFELLVLCSQKFLMCTVSLSSSRLMSTFWITSVIDLLTEVQNRYLIWGIQVGKRVLKAQLIAELVKYIRTRQYGMPGFIQIQPNVTEVI